MDNKTEILLGTQKNINSINANNYSTIELTNNIAELTEFTVNDVINSTLVFDAEREANQVYRIYGRIEYLSLLNGLKNNYSELKDYFDPIYTDNSKSILNSFDFYLVAPSSGSSYNVISNTNNTQYKRNFTVIAGKNDIEIYPAGFSSNVYGEQTYAFSFKTDFDISKYFDYLGFPMTELFLYVQYKKIGSEQMSITSWTDSGIKSKETFITKDLNIGDTIENYTGQNIQDIIEYKKDEYFQQQIDAQLFYIRTHYYEGSEKWLEWTYNPFISFRLQYLSNELYTKEISRLPENTTTLEVSIGSLSTNKLNATKSIPQILNITGQTIENWNPYITTLLSWDEKDGYVTFTVSNTYDIKFQSQIHFTQESYKYFAKTWLQEDIGSGWQDIPETMREYIENDEQKTVNIARSFNVGDKLKTKVQIIYNSAEIVPELTDIPYHATPLTNGNYVWREIVSQGYTEPLTGNVVDYPFLNGKRYLFASIILDIPPNLNTNTILKHNNTLTVFDEIYFSDNPISINETPITELDDIEKPCQ